jgi:protein-S-isoprenylcysteine O-methyltransferase Ste14
MLVSSRPPSAPARALAWAGAVAFAVSILYCGYFIFVVLERPRGPLSSATLTRAVIVDVLLFGLFAAHHSLAARPTIKRVVASGLGTGLERSFYVWVASVLLALTCLLWQPIPGTLYRTTGVLAAALTLLELGGVALTVLATRVMDPLELAGVRQLQRQAEPSRLQIVGPYHLVRHPLYLGWMLMVFAAPVMTLSRLLFAIVSSGYLLLAIPWEERSLVRMFGEEYGSYRQKIRWRVIPYLY